MDQEKELLLWNGDVDMTYRSEPPNLFQELLFQHRRKKSRYFYIVMFLSNLASAFIWVTVAYFLFPAINFLPACSSSEPLWSPMVEDNVVEFRVERPNSSYWNSQLYSATPNRMTEWAWVDLMATSTIRLEDDEANRLGLSDAAPLPDGGKAAMFGVYHNLHCLRRIRQSMYPEHYYMNRTKDEKEVDDHHDRHCLEAIRTSMMCSPDLTIMPLMWGTESRHPLNLVPISPRKCINWDKLINWVEPRSYSARDISAGLKELGLSPPEGLELEEV